MLAREPKSNELAILVNAYRREYGAMKANPAGVKSRVGNVKDIDATQLATWFHIAQVLLNLDETITKG